jgi:hypothetical protein
VGRTASRPRPHRRGQGHSAPAHSRPALTATTSSLAPYACSTLIMPYRGCHGGPLPSTPFGDLDGISPNFRCARDYLIHPASIHHMSRSSTIPRHQTSCLSPSFHSGHCSSEFCFHWQARRHPPLPINLAAHIDNLAQCFLSQLSRSHSTPSVRQSSCH